MTRSQTRQRNSIKPLKVQDVTSRYAVSKEDLIRFQEDDETLKKWKDKEEIIEKGDFFVKYEKRRGILYRFGRDKTVWETWRNKL